MSRFMKKNALEYNFIHRCIYYILIFKLGNLKKSLLRWKNTRELIMGLGWRRLTRITNDEFENAQM